MSREAKLKRAVPSMVVGNHEARWSGSVSDRQTPAGPLEPPGVRQNHSAVAPLELSKVLRDSKLLIILRSPLPSHCPIAPAEVLPDAAVTGDQAETVT